jgi:hypothetical protein
MDGGNTNLTQSCPGAKEIQISNLKFQILDFLCAWAALREIRLFCYCIAGWVVPGATRLAEPGWVAGSPGETAMGMPSTSTIR